MRMPVRLWAAFVAMCVASFAAAAADAPTPVIRDFDIATIERLGREIYDQDQWAWKASDVLAAKHSNNELSAQGMRGWITGVVDGNPRVRFVGGKGDTVEALYDVTFQGGVGALSVPADRTLLPEEIAQHEARVLARNGAANKCSQNYNTVALKDPTGDGWLVWALAATTDPDIVITGGHFRFSISADGKTVTAKDALSRHCGQFKRKAVTSEEIAGLMLNHVVSLTPVETHVFAHLSYRLQVVVGTQDGRAWKIDGGRIGTIDMDMPGFDGFAARTMAAISERCVIIARVLNEEPAKFVTADAPSMIMATERGPFKIEMPSGYAAEVVMCGRLDIVPAPNDYKIVVAGQALHILDYGVGHAKRIGALERSEGQFRFRITEGPDLTDDLKARVAKRLDGFQAATQATVSMMSLEVAPGNLVETMYRLGHVLDLKTGKRVDVVPVAGDERVSYVTGNAAKGYAVHTK